MQNGYALINEAGIYSLKRIKIAPDESMGFYTSWWPTFMEKREIPLIGLSKASYKRKPLYYAQGGIGFDPITAPDPTKLETQIKMVGNTRFWKYLGKRALSPLEILIIMASGYGILSWLNQTLTAIFGTKPA